MTPGSFVRSPADARTGAPDAPRISIRNLTKTFRRAGDGGTVVPVDNVSLDVAGHEMVVLLGPSGCGKTTLLRCVAGLEVPEAGEILINDEIVFSSARGILVPPEKRQVSMVFQSYALWPHMTLFENVAYPLRARGVGGAEVQSRVMAALETVGLGALAQQYPGRISGGQQQRVALARAVVSGTGVVLFDEPLSNVDAKVREQLRLEILRMQRMLGFSALYVTHDQAEAMALADRIAVLDDGRIEQIAPPETVYDRPVSRYVGSFIGSANIWPGRVQAAADGCVAVESAVGALALDWAAAAGEGTALPAAGAALTILTRPEQITLAPARPAGGENAWPCTVETRLFLGSHTEYIARLGEERVRVWMARGARIEEGSNAWLSIAADAFRIIRDK
ncbi:MAG: ABC transporter ATP-binding protein [Alphaproteobacteria bacterium]|nr:ABC transporter ATP-binding protein [Alphaproteobacteria bacterium]